MKTSRLMTLTGMLSMAAAALALDLPDPMRPPMGLGGARSVGGVAAPPDLAGGAGAPARAKGPVAPARARLTAVMLADAPGVNAAVIDGKVYRAGERLPDGLLVAGIDASGVTLRDAGGRARRLAVYDRPAEAAPAAADQPRSAVPAAEPASSHQAEPALAAASDLSPPAGAKAPGKDQP